MRGRDERHDRYFGGARDDGHDDAQADRDGGNDEIARWPPMTGSTAVFALHGRP